MRHTRLLLGMLFAVLMIALMPGCLSTPTPEQVITKTVELRFGTNVLRISNPQDTSFKDFMISQDGVVRIKDYRSAANEAAIVASEKQAEFQNRLIEALYNRADQRVDQVLPAVSKRFGVDIQPLEPMDRIPKSVPGTNAPIAK